MDGAVTLGEVTNKKNVPTVTAETLSFFISYVHVVCDDLTTYFSFLHFLSSTGYGEEESEAMNAAEESAAE